MEPPHSHLFLVRLWPGEDANGQAQWRGKVQHMVSGEARYFQDWTTLIDLLCAILPDLLPGVCDAAAPDTGLPPDGASP